MCEPTPTSTRYEWVTSSSLQTITTSSAVISTPPASTSTIITSSCIRRSTSAPVPGPSPEPKSETQRTGGNPWWNGNDNDGTSDTSDGDGGQEGDDRGGWNDDRGEEEGGRREEDMNFGNAIAQPGPSTTRSGFTALNLAAEGSNAPVASSRAVVAVASARVTGVSAAVGGETTGRGGRGDRDGGGQGQRQTQGQGGGGGAGGRATISTVVPENDPPRVSAVAQKGDAEGGEGGRRGGGGNAAKGAGQDENGEVAEDDDEEGSGGRTGRSGGGGEGRWGAQQTGTGGRKEDEDDAFGAGNRVDNAAVDSGRNRDQDDGDSRADEDGRDEAPNQEGSRKSEETGRSGRSDHDSNPRRDSTNYTNRNKARNHHRGLPDRSRSHPTALPKNPTLQAQAKRQQGECIEWTTVTSYSTIQGQASTSWSTGTTIETRTQVVNVPVETLYAVCEATTETTATTEMQVAPTPTPTPTPTLAPTSVGGGGSSVGVSAVQGQQQQQQDEQKGEQDAQDEQNGQSESVLALQDQATTSVVVASDSDEDATALAAIMSTSSPVPPTTLSSALTSTRASTTNPIANANEPKSTPRPTSTRGDIDSTTIQSDNNNNDSGSSKGVAAGAAIGGVIALLLLITAILMTVRWYLRRKRERKTEHLRSSWFYGGDAALPDQSGNEKIASTVRDGHANGGADRLQSRFSAPSLASRNSARVSRSVPAFLALPINHVRNSSAGRFPNIINDFRKSLAMPKARTATPSWAQRHHANVHGRPVDTTIPPPLPPLPMGTAQGAWPQPEYTDRYTPAPASRNVPPTMFDPTDDPSAPQLDMPRHQSIMPFDWIPAFASSPGPSQEILNSATDDGMRSARSSSNVHGVSGEDGNPLESYYSVYSTPSYYPGPADRDVPDVPQHPHEAIGQAISAPGRDSVEVASMANRPGMMRMPSSGPTIDIRPPSAARNLVPMPMPVPGDLPLPMAPHHGRVGTRASAGGQSSLFEYSDYDPRRDSGATMRTGVTATTRATQNWYDKPLWDGDAELNNLADSLYGGLGRSDTVTTRGGASNYTHGPGAGGRAVSGLSVASGVWTTGGEEMRSEVGGGNGKSRKSVRWGDEPEEPVPKMSEGYARS